MPIGKRRMNVINRCFGVLSLGLFLTLDLPGRAVAQGPLLKVGVSIQLPYTQGGFDFSEIDTARHRLLLAHSGNKTLDVVDLVSHRLLKSVPTGVAQDSAIDVQHGVYFVSVSSPPSMVMVDANTLTVTGSVKLPTDADLLAYNPSNGLVYVGNDTAGELWVIDPIAKKIVKTLVLAPVKGMEGLAFDAQNKRLYQLVSHNDTLYVIDSDSNRAINSWSVLPAASPHGLVLLPNIDGLLVAGATGMLVLINRETGKVLASTSVEQHIDQFAYDGQLQRAYLPGGTGILSIIGLQGDKLIPLGSVPGAAGRNAVVDPATHIVWIAAFKNKKCFVQSFEPAN